MVWCLVRTASSWAALPLSVFLSLALPLSFTHIHPCKKHVVCIIKFKSFDVRVKKRWERENERVREFSVTPRSMCESEEWYILSKKGTEREQERNRVRQRDELVDMIVRMCVQVCELVCCCWWKWMCEWMSKRVWVVCGSRMKQFLTSLLNVGNKWKANRAYVAHTA